MPTLFSSPPKPKAAAATPAPATAPVTQPTSTDPSVQQAAADVKQKYRRSGRSQTILTSPTGVASPAPTAYKTALGA